MAVAINEFTTSNTPYNPNPIDTLNFDLGEWEAVGYLFALTGFFTVLAFIFLMTLKKKVQ